LVVGGWGFGGCYYKIRRTSQDSRALPLTVLRRHGEKSLYRYGKENEENFAAD
jgi:hypothetical protein